MTRHLLRSDLRLSSLSVRAELRGAGASLHQRLGCDEEMTDWSHSPSRYIDQTTALMRHQTYVGNCRLLKLDPALRAARRKRPALSSLQKATTNFILSADLSKNCNQYGPSGRGG